jgi:anti-sigma B factor antagonist
MSNLSIGQRMVGDIAVVDLDGKVTLGETNRQLHEALRALVTAGTNKIVLNLKKVKSIDSSGLGEIVAGYSTLRSHGGSLVLANIPERVVDLMTITKLYTVFDVFESEDEAIANLQSTEQTTQPLTTGFPSKAKSGSSIF